MSALNLTRPHLAGWSLGGCTALSLAAHHPDRVGKVGANCCCCAWFLLLGWVHYFVCGCITSWVGALLLGCVLLVVAWLLQ